MSLPHLPLIGELTFYSLIKAGVTHNLANGLCGNLKTPAKEPATYGK